MSTHMRARLASDKVDNNGHFKPLAGFRIALLGTPPLFGKSELAADVTKADGTFEFSNYRRDLSPPGFHRTLELVAQDSAGRVLPFASTHSVSSRFAVDESGRIIFEDIDDVNVFEGDFIIREADARGFAVTLGTGQAEGLSHGNAVTLLVDNTAFTHTAARFRDAEESILMSQLTFSLPVSFNADASLETTNVVFEFRDPAPDAAHPRAAGVGDVRPERLLLQAADDDVDIRILLHSYELPLFIKIIAGVLLFPFAGTDGIFAINGLLDDTTSVDEAKRYFGAAGRPNIKIQDFKQPLLNAGVLHARLAIVDRLHAICMGASFAQGYVDTHDHAIDAPTRGGSDGLPNHDAGIGVTGPAVADLHKAMKLFWNAAAPNDPLPPLPSVPPTQTAGGDGICSMQIVRTLSEDEERFGKGEKGILEAYLRAIAKAENFIYLENQYFTNDRIGDALVKVMKKNPDLKVIVLLNIQPDVWFYPLKQRCLITRIRRAIDETPDTPKQFGVFTRWTHETTGQPSSRMLPIYVHSKIGIVDDAWATVGSANLDGLSLDSYLLSDAINKLLPGDPFREQRAIEVNTLLFKQIDGHPQSNVVDILRRKLWAEHLGFLTAPDVPDPAASELIAHAGSNWLKLWSDRAAATLLQLRNTPSSALTGMARVLPWPSDNTTHKTPRDHLKALGIRSHFVPGKPGRVEPLKSTRAFDFEKGDWKKDSKARIDYD